MDKFKGELKDVPFVRSPASSASELHDQYVHDLSTLLDIHASLVPRVPKKYKTEWLSESYQNAKSLTRQFERAWRKNKNQLTSRLRRQIALCNKITNKDKSKF